MKTNIMFLTSWCSRMISFIFLLMLFQSGFSRTSRDLVLEVIAIANNKDFRESQVHEIIIFPNPEFQTMFIDGIKRDSNMNPEDTIATSLFNGNRTDYILSIDSAPLGLCCLYPRKEPNLNL